MLPDWWIFLKPPSTGEFLRVSASFDAFVDSDLLQSAVLFQLVIIGEAVANLSVELKNKYPDVDWIEIKGFRNYVIHEYFGIELLRVWEAANEDVPKLREQALTIFQIEFPDLLRYIP